MSLVFVGARSLPTGCPRCTGEHGPRTVSDWQAGSELAWVTRSSFSFCMWLAVAACVSGRAVPRAGAFTSLRIWTVPGAGVTRCHSRLLAHARSRRVARGVQGSTDPEQHPIGRQAMSLLGSSRISFSFCIWLAVAACVCGRAVQRAGAFTFVQI